MISWNDLIKSLGSETVLLKTIDMPQSCDSADHFPITAPPAPAPAASTLVPTPTPTPVSVLVATPPPTPVATAPTALSKKLIYSKQNIDPIVLGLSLFDPLYEASPYNTQHIIEKTAAIKLESDLDKLYKSNNGRSRGWTKVGLESMLKPRCASGGNLKELDRAKKPYIWALVNTDKILSSFLDFICCARHIYCAICDDDKKTVYLYPAADDVIEDAPKKLFVVNNTGYSVKNIETNSELISYVDTNGYDLLPPPSVIHSLGSLKLEELESVGSKLGMMAITGNKAQRVHAIATYKTRQRLLVARD